MASSGLSVLLFFLASSCLAVSIDGEGLLAMARLPRLSSLFEEGYIQLFGDSNLMLHGHGKKVHISLDERTGAGFASEGRYLHGFFSASIKLPSDYAAGVVVAFYTSNRDVYETTHDELDFEFLGNIRGREWRVQTNVYGNGSTSAGREERFYIDDVPVREVVRTKSMGGQFPSKPTPLYPTIWDGSSWATSGGRYKVNYRYAPYVAEFTDLVLHGCVIDAASHRPPVVCESDGANAYGAVALSSGQRTAMQRFRAKYMTYGYCYDRLRYPTPPPECSAGAEAALFLLSGKVSVADRRRHVKRHRRGAGDSAF